MPYSLLITSCYDHPLVVDPLPFHPTSCSSMVDSYTTFFEWGLIRSKFSNSFFPLSFLFFLFFHVSFTIHCYSSFFSTHRFFFLIFSSLSLHHFHSLCQFPFLLIPSSPFTCHHLPCSLKVIIIFCR